ncbi:hypothetical protein [Nonomuraea sp. JJY05]|uniref:hypothetical protein n=1 Tax=Nonomuraea sp. JJY05 TaxID=3350255 RepID=UPI00373E8BAB
MPDEPRSPEYFKQLFTSAGKGKGGLYDFWVQQSYGKLNLDLSTVQGWYTLPYTRAQEQQKDRLTKWTDCAKNFQKKLWQLNPNGIIVIWNDVFDTYGASSYPLTLNGTQRNYMAVSLDREGWHPAIAAQEMGHGYGLGHSFAYPDMEYGDSWDSMSSWTSGWFFNPPDDPDFGIKGPGLIAPTRMWMGWITQDRIRECSTACGPAQVVGLDHPEVGGPLVIKIPGDGGAFYTIEYRTKEGWDQGMPGNSVVVHKVEPSGRSLLMPGWNAALWRAGESFQVDQLHIELGRLDGNSAWVCVNLPPCTGTF